jgi:HAD superfamily hydrolase (TIGR01490 family)
MSIAIYDMDRTITRRGSLVPWLRFWLRHEAPWRVLLLPVLAVAGLGYGLGIIDRGRLKAVAQRLVMGRRVARARVLAAAASFADGFVAESVYPEAISALAAARGAGARLVLATASNRFYVDAIAERLGFDAVIATESRWQGGWLLAEPGSANCYGVEKRDRVAAWLAEYAEFDAKIGFYSDHQSDLPTFDLVVGRGGSAVAVNPTEVLRAMATTRGWTIIDWGATTGSWFERA